VLRNNLQIGLQVQEEFSLHISHLGSKKNGIKTGFPIRPLKHEQAGLSGLKLTNHSY